MPHSLVHIHAQVRWLLHATPRVQLSPVVPGGQTHSKSTTPTTVQLAPLGQGCDAHGSTIVQLGVVDPVVQTQSGGPPDCGRHTVSSGQETVEQMPSVGKRKDHTHYMCTTCLVC